MFQNIRLSKHFVLLDFMQCREVYTSRMRLTPAVLTPDARGAGQRLCDNLLEPMIDRFGPISLSSGFRPECVLQRPGFQTPHRWGDPSGGAAAADVVLHNWVNEERPPIHACIQWLREDREFHRFITYAGSEFICASVATGYNRHAVYENVIQRDQERAKYLTWTNKKSDVATLPEHFPARRDWRRKAGDPPQAYKKELQAQHVRVGQFFTMLDFCRSERGLEEGFRWVPPLSVARNQIAYARMAAEILDPLVAEVGRISVTKGMLPRSLANLEEDPWAYRWVDGDGAVEFLLPMGTPTPDALAVLTHPNIKDIQFSEHPSYTYQCTVRWSPFEPQKRWSSAANPLPPVRTRTRA